MIPSTNTRRREMRYRQETTLRLVWNDECYVSMTEDVSLRGMRIQTDALPPLRAEVTIVMHLPGFPRAVAINASVAHAGLIPGTTQASIGLCFGDNEPEIRAAWSRFIDLVRIAGARRYTWESNPCLLSVYPDSTEALEEIQQQAEAGGAIFIETDIKLCPAEPVRIALVHPRTQKIHVLDGIVREVWTAPADQGTLVALDPLDATTAHDLRCFVDKGFRAAPTWLLDAGALDSLSETETSVVQDSLYAETRRSA